MQSGAPRALITQAAETRNRVPPEDQTGPDSTSGHLSPPKGLHPADPREDLAPASPVCPPKSGTVGRSPMPVCGSQLRVQWEGRLELPVQPCRPPPPPHHPASPCTSLYRPAPPCTALHAVVLWVLLPPAPIAQPHIPLPSTHPLLDFAFCTLVAVPRHGSSPSLVASSPSPRVHSLLATRAPWLPEHARLSPLGPL